MIAVRWLLSCCHANRFGERAGGDTRRRVKVTFTRSRLSGSRASEIVVSETAAIPNPQITTYYNIIMNIAHLQQVYYIIVPCVVPSTCALHVLTQYIEPVIYDDAISAKGGDFCFCSPRESDKTRPYTYYAHCGHLSKCKL